MNTRDLQYFVALVKYKNYTQVAKLFKVSQPTITQSIQRLEREFNTSLIRKDKVHRDDMVTRSGMMLFENAKLINKKIDLTHEEINHAKLKQIRFGLPPIIGKMYFSQIVNNTSEELMKRLKIVTGGSHELLTQLKDGKIDIAVLGSNNLIHQDGIFAELIATRPFTIIVSSRHPIAKRESVSFKELADENFINYDQQYFHYAALKEYCTYAGIEPKTTPYRVPDISWVKELVRQNRGISLMVKDGLKNEPGIVALNISDPIPERFGISIAVREGYFLSPEEEEFIDGLKMMK
ncbi:MAG: LysR family transcriptional regulator [Limosilactobacillus sp.]|uniref:LysR family transcriptional regulator n=1 Tax=Limosilactobacillus sp. TaxID=2773925 RepID=UPI00270368C6|nr:LysR family transcriptional regulator [Limosilactobacillus sp.]